MNLASRLSSLSPALFTGDYGCFPILLSLSSTEHSIIITALSRQEFSRSLAKYADTSVASTIAASRTRIYYSTSPTSAKQLITLLTQHELTTANSFDPVITLPELPSLVVLHEPSLYFRNHPDPLISSYLDLITTFIAAVTSLQGGGSNSTSLGVFDSDLINLELPVLKAPTPSYLFHPDYADDPQESTNRRKYSVYGLARKYFKWVGRFNIHHVDNSSSIRRSLELYHTDESSAQPTERHEWEEEIPINN